VEKELVSGGTAGQDLVYDIHVNNIGGQPAPGVVLTDEMPAHTTCVSDDGGGVAQNGQVTWNLGLVDTGERRSIELTLHLADDVPPVLS